MRGGGRIRPATVDDGHVMQEIERLAGQRFREVGLDAIADDEPLGLDVLASYATSGRAWVAVDVSEEPVGYVLVDVVDGRGHIEQLSVHPDHQGRGLGRSLIGAAAGWARERGFEAMTLTTYTTVPWNAPLYAHLGFRELVDAEIGPELRSLRAVEAMAGLDPTLRCCMVLALVP